MSAALEAGLFLAGLHCAGCVSRVERRLREGSAQALADRFRQAGDPDRQRILYDILVRVYGQAGLGRFVENSSRKLSPADREAMLWDGLDRVVGK